MNVIKKYPRTLAKINLDPKLIRIVIQNLLSNSIKYTPAGGTITLTIEQKTKDVIMSVKDSGLGIPVGQQGNIFTKLFRADNVRQAETDGTGLGLYVAKAVVAGAGGKIWFTSVENKGSTFYFTLPLKGTKTKVGDKGLISLT